MMIRPGRSTARAAALAVAAAVVALATACSSTTSGQPTTSGPAPGSPGGSGGGGSGGGGSKPKLAVRWHTKLGGEPGSETQLVTVTADSSGVYTSDVSGHVFAIDPSTGKVRWRAQPGTRSGLGVNVAQGVVFYYDSNDSLTTLSASTGRVLWKAKIAPPDSDKAYRPAVAAGVVGLTTDDDLRAVAPLTGKPKWRNTAFRFGWESIIGAGSRFYLAKTGYQSPATTIAAVDARTGKRAWQTTVPNVADSPVDLGAADGVLIVHTRRSGGELSGSFVALSAATGKPAWKADATGIGPGTPPVVVAGNVVYPSLKGVVAYSIKDGSVVYRTEMEKVKVADGLVRCGTYACSAGLNTVVALDSHGKHVTDGKLPSSDDTAELGQDAGGVVYLASSSTVYRFS